MSKSHKSFKKSQQDNSEKVTNENDKEEKQTRLWTI